MAFDFSTLVTDRTQQDVAYARQLAEKLVTGTATEAEIAEWNSFTLRGVYNHTDLNRVTAAMDALKAKLEGYGYAVPGYQRIKIDHNPPPVPSESRLPEGYTELTYIESTGTQYIDTGFKPNQSTKVVMDLEFTGHHSSHPFAFGARDSTGEADFYAYINGGGTLTAPWAFVCGSILNQHTKTGEGRQAVSFGNDGMIVNGVFASVTAVTFQSTVNLWLFCANRNGATQYLSSLKLYSCQIYDNGTIVRDYVPCINPSGDVGLFDVVNKQFYGNAGTGAFVAGGRVGVILPDGYTRLSHIESTGTQYIDTGFVPNQDTRVVCDCEYEATSAASWLFGVRVASGSGAFAFLAYSSKFRTDYGSSYELYFATTITKATSVDKNKNVTTVNGSATLTDATATFSSKYNLALLAINTAGTISGYSNAKIKSCQIYDNGTLVRDFVPCINPDGSVGLYDLVTAAFFGNSGTGSFVAGAIPRELPEGYTQVEYIQSSGTQYINTGFKPNNNTHIIMDVEATATGTYVYWGARTDSLVNTFCCFALSGTSVRSDFGTTQKSISTSKITSRVVVEQNKNVCTHGGLSVSHDAQVFQCDFPLYLLAANSNGTVEYASMPAKLYSCQIYDNGMLTRDFVPCINASGAIGLYDVVNSAFYANAGSGAFTAGEEVAPPVTTSVTVVPDNATEYDPYTWYEFDWPTPEAMTMYMLNVAAIRTVLSVLQSTPRVPLDMEKLMVQEANDIEQIVLDVYRQITIMPTTFIACGEALCGGDNL